MRPFPVRLPGRVWIRGNSLETNADLLDFADGGVAFAIFGRPVSRGDTCEYAGFYRRLAALIRAGANQFGRARISASPAPSGPANGA